MQSLMALKLKKISFNAAPLKRSFCAISVIIVFILLHTGCREQVAVDVLNPDEVADILAQRMLSSVNTADSSATDSLQTLQAVLDNNNITYHKFTKTIHYYRSQNAVWIQILEKTAEILEQEKDSLNKAANADTQK